VKWISASFIGLSMWGRLDVPAAAGMLHIPAAVFEPGSSLDEIVAAASWCNRILRREACKPEDFWHERRHGSVSLNRFLVDRTEVSVAAYARCVSAGQCLPHQMSSATTGRPPSEEGPVTMVRRVDAEAYCAFRGARLPTEYEFELTARGRARRQFPWGNLFDANRVNGGAPVPEGTNASDGYELLAPVATFRSGRTPLGVLQLVGNAAEWTASDALDSAGQSTGYAVVAGGHFGSPPWQLRAAAREHLKASERRPTVGFRCVRSGG
jgi:formylglycine-generating enzyme required for sulfatase activity